MAAAGARIRFMRHNPRMRRMSTVAWPGLLALLLAVLAGCSDDERDPFAPGEGNVATPSSAPQRLAWRGMLACADCDGIDMHLTLEREGTPPRYRLLESFVLADTAERFHEQGTWRRDGTLLRLQSDAGALRTFALEPDGTLSVRDRRGRVAGGQRLLPVDPHRPR